MSDNSLQSRIDNLAIAYVNAHYDITQMSATEYLQKFNAVSKEIVDAIQNK